MITKIQQLQHRKYQLLRQHHRNSLDAVYPGDVYMGLWITDCIELADNERVTEGDRVSTLHCYRQLLEQMDGLPHVISDGGRYYYYYFLLFLLLLLLLLEWRSDLAVEHWTCDH